MRVSALCWLYKIYPRADNPLHAYLHHFVAARNTRTSDVRGELPLVIPRFKTDQFSLSCLPAIVILRNLLPSGALSGGTLRFPRA